MEQRISTKMLDNHELDSGDSGRFIREDYVNQNKSIIERIASRKKLKREQKRIQSIEEILDNH